MVLHILSFQDEDQLLTILCSLHSFQFLYPCSQASHKLVRGTFWLNHCYCHLDHKLWEQDSQSVDKADQMVGGAHFCIVEKDSRHQGMIEEEFGKEGSLLFLVVDDQTEFVDMQSRGLGVLREGAVDCCTEGPVEVLGSRMGSMSSQG